MYVDIFLSGAVLGRRCADVHESRKARSLGCVVVSFWVSSTPLERPRLEGANPLERPISGSSETAAPAPKIFAVHVWGLQAISRMHSVFTLLERPQRSVGTPFWTPNTHFPKVVRFSRNSPRLFPMGPGSRNGFRFLGPSLGYPFLDPKYPFFKSGPIFAILTTFVPHGAWILEWVSVLGSLSTETAQV